MLYNKNSYILNYLINKFFNLRFPIFKSEVVKGKWCLPFLGSDRSVIRRSQYHFYQQDKERPTQVATYVTFPSIIHVMVVLIVAGIFAVLTKFGLGRKLLLQVGII